MARSALAPGGAPDIVALIEDDVAVSMHNLLHVARRVHARWLFPGVADALDEPDMQESDAAPRLPEMMLPGLILYEDAYMSERCLYNRTSWVRDLLGDPPVVETCGPALADVAAPEAVSPVSTA